MRATEGIRVGVIGAGAIGGWVAARLALAGTRVLALSRSGPIESIQIDEGGTRETARLSGLEGAVQLLVIAVKAPALAAAAESARPMIGPDTVIVPMLNGVPWWFLGGPPLEAVDPDARIAAALPLGQVIGCVVHAACRRAGPGAVEVVHADKLILGEAGGGTSARVEDLAQLFERAGIRTERSDGIRRAIWYKLWGNATINPLSALTRANADRLLADPALRSFMAAAMDELSAIGAAIGCPISESAEDRMAVTARLGAFKPSMLQDVEAGRPIELEALVGAPLEIARREGIAAPTLERIHAMTRLMAAELGLI